MAMATEEEMAQKIHNEQPFSLFETGLKATSKNLKLVKFRVESRHTLLILRTINFWSKSSRVFKCWEPFYVDDLLSLNAPRWIWSSPRSKKELLQGKTVIMRLLLIASLMIMHAAWPPSMWNYFIHFHYNEGLDAAVSERGEAKLPLFSCLCGHCT